jgi:hypothetical protein
MPTAGRYLYRNAPRAGGPTSILLLFYVAQVTSSDASKIQEATPGLEDFIRLRPHRQNLQCRLIAGVGNGEVCDERALDTAAEPLTRSLSWVGLCGRFKESLMLMAKTFGC